MAIYFGLTALYILALRLLTATPDRASPAPHGFRPHAPPDHRPHLAGLQRHPFDGGVQR